MQGLLAALYIYFLSPLLLLVVIVIFVYFAMSWLFTLNIVDYRNPTARQIYGTLQSVVEPLAAPIRRVVPPLGNFDLAPLILLLGLQFLRGYALPTLIRMVPA